MKVDIVSAVPEVLSSWFNESILKRGASKELIEINIHNLREWSGNKHRAVDDTPYGGGAGMLLQVAPLYRAIEDLRKEGGAVILTTPRGRLLNQTLVRELLSHPQLVILCGHYKGVDERIVKHVDYEISIGDFILTGGEIPAAIITDAVCRLVPGVISDIDSANSDSFENQLLDCAYYTRPAEFMGDSVPEVLQDGNHKLITRWRLEDALKKTRERRPDLYQNYLNAKIKEHTNG